MTDLEMRIACAQALGLVHNFDGDVFFVYGPDSERLPFDPLHDDAQAMALVKHFCLQLHRAGTWGPWWVKSRVMMPEAEASHADNLNRAIVECVAKMQASK